MALKDQETAPTAFQQIVVCMSGEKPEAQYGAALFNTAEQPPNGRIRVCNIHGINTHNVYEVWFPLEREEPAAESGTVVEDPWKYTQTITR